MPGPPSPPDVRGWPRAAAWRGQGARASRPPVAICPLPEVPAPAASPLQPARQQRPERQEHQEPRPAIHASPILAFRVDTLPGFRSAGWPIGRLEPPRSTRPPTPRAAADHVRAAYPLLAARSPSRSRSPPRGARMFLPTCLQAPALASAAPTAAPCRGVRTQVPRSILGVGVPPCQWNACSARARRRWSGRARGGGPVLPSRRPLGALHQLAEAIARRIAIILPRHRRGPGGRGRLPPRSLPSRRPPPHW